MKRTRTILVAALSGIAIIGAAPSMAARRGDNRAPSYQQRAPAYRQNVGQDGPGFREARIALDSITLERKQRDKIYDLTDKYSKRIQDARRDSKLSPSKREDRIWKAQQDLRKDVMKVLTKEQRARVESIAQRGGYGGAYNGNRDPRTGNGRHRFGR